MRDASTDPYIEANPYDQQTDPICLFVVTAAVALLLAPWLWTPDRAIVSPTELGTDLIAKQWPNARYIVDSWHQWKKIPLWHTATMGGVPIAGNPSMLLAYPPYWLIFLFPIGWSFTVYFALHLAWAGWGAYWLARNVLRTSPTGALLSALSFSLSAKMIAHIGGGHLDVVAAIAWLPWLWLAVDNLTGRTTWPSIAGMAAATAAQAMTHLPTLWLSALVVGSWGLSRQLTNQGDGASCRWVQPAIGGLGSLVLAIGLSAVHVFPMLELLPFSTRGDMTLVEASRYALPAPLLMGLALPTALAFPEWVLFAGVVTLSLAPASWQACDRDWKWWFLMAVIIVGIIFSLGHATPLYKLLFHLLPGMRWFRVPTRMMFPVQLALALLAGMGWDASQGSQFQRKKLQVGWISVLVLIVALGAVWSHFFPKILDTPLISPGIALATLVTLIAQSRMTSVGPVAPLVLAALITLEAKTLAPQFLAATETSNLIADSSETEFLESQPGQFRTYCTRGHISLANAVVHGLETANGNDPFQFEHYVHWMNAASGCDLEAYTVSVPACAGNEIAPDAHLAAQPDHTLLSIGNVQYVVSDHVLDDWQKIVWRSEDTRIYKNSEVLPRAYVVSEVVKEENTVAALTSLKTYGPRSTATIPQEGTVPNSKSAPYHTAQVLRRSPNHVMLQANGPGWLVLSEAWAPGWQASIDGVRTQVYRTNVAFRGLLLPEGPHTIGFDYKPTGWIWGRWISLVTAITLVMITITALWNQKKVSSI